MRGIQLQVHKDSRYQGYLLYDGCKASEGYYLPIIEGIDQMLSNQLSKHSRVNIIRFDVGGLKCEPSEANKIIERGMKSLRRRVANYSDREGINHGIREIGTVWVREISPSKGVHYHLAIVFKAVFRSGKVKASDKNTLGIFKLIEESFSSLAVNFGSKDWKTGKRRNHFYVVNRDDTNAIASAMKGLSYLAKASTKHHTGDGSRLYSFSKTKQAQTLDRVA